MDTLGPPFFRGPRMMSFKRRMSMGISTTRPAWWSHWWSHLDGIPKNKSKNDQKIWQVDASWSCTISLNPCYTIYDIYTTLVCLLTRSGSDLSCITHAFHTFRSLQYDPYPYFESYPKFDTLPFSWHRFCGFCCLSCHVFAILCPTISTPICSLLLANMPQSQKVIPSDAFKVTIGHWRVSRNTIK